MRLIDEDILSMNIPQPEPEAGNLLIAQPLMTEACFRRSTVFLIDHDAESGSMGLVTNRLSNYTLNDAVDGIEIDNEIPIYIGGPVHKERLYYLHTLGADIPQSIEVVPGLFVSGDFDKVKELVNLGIETEGKIRFFLGYSGWEKGQLRRELDNNDWAVATVENPSQVLALDENDAWRAAVTTLGKQYSVWLNFPMNAQMN